MQQLLFIFDCVHCSLRKISWTISIITYVLFYSIWSYNSLTLLTLFYSNVNNIRWDHWNKTASSYRETSCKESLREIYYIYYMCIVLHVRAQKLFCRVRLLLQVFVVYQCPRANVIFAIILPYGVE